MRCLAWMLALGLCAIGCRPLVALDGDTDAEEAESSTTATPDPPSTSGSPDSTTTTSPGTTTSTPLGSSTSASSSTGWDESSGIDETGALPASPCMADSECASGHCYLEGVLGGLCGEGSSDADCELGCNAPNSLLLPPEGSTCGTGMLGEDCEDDTACIGLVCAAVIDVPGILELSRCSECDEDADCRPGHVCDVDFASTVFDGAWLCVASNTEPLGSFCDPVGSGDEACSAGYCAIADLKGLLELGVCSECGQDDDCEPGQTCVAPQVTSDGSTVAGFCA